VVVILKHQPWNDDPAQPERAIEVEWNMWTRRDPPYNDLDVNTHIILVSGGGPSKGVLTWEVQAVAVAKGRYESHSEAWRLLRQGLGLERLKSAGLTRRAFLASEYTARTPAAGWLLGWAYTPVRELMLPRPDHLKVRPSGWAFMDRLSGGDGTDPGSHGQGGLSDPVLRRLVELTAMRFVEAWLRSEGHRSIRDTSATKPYDLEVGPERAPSFRVEVKGMTGELGRVRVTTNEVLSARGGGVRTMLAIVHDIRLAFDGDTSAWQAKGGLLHLIDPWLPDDRSLTPATYTFNPLGSS
jgi:hypothetical protein